MKTELEPLFRTFVRLQLADTDRCPPQRLNPGFWSYGSIFELHIIPDISILLNFLCDILLLIQTLLARFEEQWYSSVCRPFCVYNL